MSAETGARELEALHARVRSLEFEQSLLIRAIEGEQARNRNLRREAEAKQWFEEHKWAFVDINWLDGGDA